MLKRDSGFGYTLKYSLRSDGNYRVQQYDKNGHIGGWRVYAPDGTLVCQGKKWPGDAWDNRTDDKVVKEIKSFTPAPDYAAYLRFKDIPKSGKSRDYASGETLAGVSVYELDWDFSAGEWVLDGGASPFQYILNRLRGDVPAYIVTGERVGTGSDGEPLLTGVKIIGPARQDGDGWVLSNV
jgi:hypothetical protein